MLQKKICMVGSFAVGKTSLVARFVKGIFSDRYLTTVGVKIDQKDLEIEGQQLRFMLWDLHGEDEFQRIRPTYLRGTAGALLVADGTRPDTLDVALRLGEEVQSVAGDVPLLLLLNKADLKGEWQISAAQEAELVESGWQVLQTSAKTGAGVEESFRELGRLLLAAP